MTEYEVNDQPCGKRAYPDKKSARTAANQRMKRGGGSRKGKVKHLRAYPCPCGAWHLSSKP